MLFKFTTVVVIVLVGWAYKSIQPPPPKICGSPNGPPITSSRVRLREGRHIAYRETGVVKEKAKYKIIIVHAYGDCKEFGLFPSQELVDKLQIYFLWYDRAGYGESDPDPKRTIKTESSDVDKLADLLELGPKFYVFGISLGGTLIWGFLKYIPHRLEGAVLVAPPINFWWPSLPSDLSRSAFSKKMIPDQRSMWIAHNIPSILYWWMTQKWFASCSPLSEFPELLSKQDTEIFQKRLAMPIVAECEKKAQQQGIYGSIVLDGKLACSKWDFDPVNMSNPIPDKEGSVHLWHGYEDRLVSVELQRYVAKSLPWIRYHEYAQGGHLFVLVDGMTDIMLKSLLLGEVPRLI